MTAQDIILNRLLDKFENSKHLSDPGTSSRRVMLRVEKKELPEYRYEDAATRDAFNEAADALEREHLVQLTWIQGRPLLSSVVLNLEQVMQCYAVAGRVHPKARAAHISDLIHRSLEDIAIPWIMRWKTEVCSAAETQRKVPSFCKTDDTPLKDLLCAFREYAALSGSTTMRAFSSRCFSDTKYFERNVRELFLRIARKYDPDLSLACEENDLGEREQLAFLGIYARPEHYELSGNCTIRTLQGELNVGATLPYGLALPSTLIDAIVGIDLDDISCITFIENKTNYDTYILSEQQPDELVVYHGGFLSPQKRKLFAWIAAAASPDTNIRFWADIDLGGFRMFEHLQQMIPAVQPMRMSGEFVDRFHGNGLIRSHEYLSQMQTDLDNGKYVLFQDSAERILYYGVTIEQEVFLSESVLYTTN